MKKAASTLLWASLFYSAWLFSLSLAKRIPSFPSSLVRPEQVLLSSQDPNGLYETNYFTQILDHFNFNPQSYETFQQRYLVNRTYWGGPRTNSPFFVYTGNEGDIEWFAQNTGFLFETAPHFKALLVFIEGYPPTCKQQRKSKEKTSNSFSGCVQGLHHKCPSTFSAGAALTASNSAQMTGGAAPIPGLSFSQYRSLLSLIAPDYGNSKALSGNGFLRLNNEEWILDTGASMHMTGASDRLIDPVKVNSISVSIPNGAEVRATHVGKLSLGGSFVLNDVLYIPEFTCNLISIAKLSSDLNCSITFLSNLCVIQDRSSKKMIGVGELKGGSTTCAVWHVPILHIEQLHHLTLRFGIAGLDIHHDS